MKTTILAAIFIALGLSASASCDTDRQIEVLALNMYHEARGDGPDAMQMVGEVTLNRVESHRYPNNICDVVYQRRQFSWTHVRSDHATHETDSWEIALELAEGLIRGEIDLFNNGATHFLNPDAVRVMPRWTQTFQQVGRIGGHVFYEMTVDG